MRWLATALVWLIAVYAGVALVLYVFQSRYLYFPNMPSREVEATPANIGLAYESIQLKTTDGETLDAWFVPAPQARGTVLYLHGNGGNIGHRLDPISVFHQLRLNVLIFDYRGYGSSTGKPDEEGTYEDARTAWTYLTRKLRIPPSEIVVFGESLGGSVGAWLAERHPPGALILYASFTSVPDIAQQLYPIFPAKLLSRYRYDTLSALANTRCPVLILHGQHDEIIPFSHAQELYMAANEPKRLLALRGGHNDALFISREDYARAVNELLARLP